MVGAPPAEAPTTEPVQADPEPQPSVTETPATEVVVESAAPEAETAAALQVQPPEEKPDYITRADWEREKADVATKAASDALEADRRRRQTDGARKALQEKRDADLRAETLDVVRATLSSQLGVDPALIPDAVIDTAITRAARRQAESITGNAFDLIDNSSDFLMAKITGETVELTDGAGPLAQRLAPKFQSVYNAGWEGGEAAGAAKAVEEFKKNELPKQIDAEIARRNAETRDNGPDDVKRPEGQPAGNLDRAHQATIDRIYAGTHDATDAAYWREYESRGRK